jgi:hypothetical protein
MSTIDVNPFGAAMQDAADLLPWIEPNAHALEWEPMDEVVRRALDGPVPDDYAMGVPLLRYANGDPARPLLTAMTDPRIPRASRRWLSCDILGTKMREPRTLWVPCGASVVQVTMRNHAADLLQDWTGTDFVWS